MLVQVAAVSSLACLDSASYLPSGSSCVACKTPGSLARWEVLSKRPRSAWLSLRSSVCCLVALSGAYSCRCQLAPAVLMPLLHLAAAHGGGPPPPGISNGLQHHSRLPFRGPLSALAKLSMALAGTHVSLI